MGFVWEFHELARRIGPKAPAIGPRRNRDYGGATGIARASQRPASRVDPREKTSAPMLLLRSQAGVSQLGGNPVPK